MNTDLLFQLYAIHSPSGGEKKMRKFIKRYIYKNCGDCKVEQDKSGNLLVTKGVSETYPCLASHIDQVQKNHSKDFTCVVVGDQVIGWSCKSQSQQGLGADDKNGIFVCLECLRMYDVMKCAFFVGEEVGCVGSNAVDLGFFKDCRFIVEPDRMNGHDLITSMFVGGVCSEDFIKAIGADAYGYKEAEGSITDVGELVERGVGISCLNLSCGYYGAHTDHEITVLSELRNCLDFVCHIVETCTDVYTYEYVDRWATYYGGYHYGRGLSRSGTYLDDEEEYYNDGYHDEDITMMSEYLRYGISLQELQTTYLQDFYACEFLGKEGAKGVIEDIFTFLKDEETWKDEEDFDESVSEIMKELKVS